MTKMIREFLSEKGIQRMLGVAFLLAFAMAGWNNLTNDMAIFLKISMKTQESGMGVLYYDAGKGLNEECTSSSFISGDGRFHELSFRIPFMTTIYGLRFDPPSLKTGEEIIKRVQLVDHYDWVLHRFSLDRLKAIHQIKGFVQEKGEIFFRIEEGADDPQIHIHVDKPLRLASGRIVWTMLIHIMLEGMAIFLCCVVLVFIWSRWRWNKLKTYNIFFYSLVAAAVLFIFLSNPFLVERYDPWKWHLKCIAEFFYNGVSESGWGIWYRMWASIFKFIGIGDIFIWAKIIHVFQFILAATALYYFSKTALIILNKSNSSMLQDIKPSEGFSSSGNDNNDINKFRTIQIKYLSLFAVFLWFIGNGTFSVGLSAGVDHVVFSDVPGIDHPFILVLYSFNSY